MIKNVKKWEIIVIFHYHWDKYRGAAHSISNLKFSTPNEILGDFHDISSYHFIIKELEEGFEGEFNCLGKNTKKCRIFSVLIKKNEGKKLGKKLKILYPTNYHLLIVQNLWQSHYWIFLKRFIKLNVNMDLKKKKRNFARSTQNQIQRLWVLPWIHKR